MPASTQWRVRNIANNSGQTGIGEVYMTSSVGGANECVGGTPITNSTYGGSYGPDRAFDGNTTSNWFGSGGYGVWIGYQFPTPVDIVEIRITVAVEENAATPRVLAFEYYDGAEWQVAWYGFNTDYANGIPVVFLKPAETTAHSHWGIVNEQGAGGNRDLVLSTLAMRDGSGNNLALAPIKAKMFPEAPGSPAGNGFDGDNATILYSGKSQYGTLVDYDFGIDTILGSMAFTGDPAGGNITRAPGTGAIIGGPDGRSFLRIVPISLTTNDYAIGNTATVAAVPAAPTPNIARQWRVRINSIGNPGRGCVVASEIELFAVRGGPDLTPTLTGPDPRVLYHDQGYDAAWHAFDGSYDTIWHDSCSFGGVGYIGWNFDEPTNVAGFSYAARGGGYYDQDSIVTGGLEYFETATNSWVRRFTIPDQTPWGDKERRAFFDPASAMPDDSGYRFWEVTGIAGGDGSYSGWSRANFARAAGGPNLADNSYVGARMGGPFQAGSVISLFQSGLGFAQWFGSADGSHWFAVDFGENNQKKIRQVRLHPSTDGPQRSWTTFDIAAWNNPDRSDRVVLQRFDTTWQPNTEQSFNLDNYGTIEPVAAVGSASATSSAQAIYLAAGTAVGSAAGTGVADGQIMALGKIGTRGTAMIVGAATGRSDPTRQTAGSAAGAGVVTGAGAAVGTISTVGSSSASSLVDSGSAATGIISTNGGATATSSALGAGTGNQFITGSASATGSADAGGAYKPSESVGRAFGQGVAGATSSRFFNTVGIASAQGDVIATATRVRASVGAAAGQGSALAVPDANRQIVGSAAGAGLATGRMVALTPTQGTALLVSAAQAGSRALHDARGSAAGTGLALAKGENPRDVRGTASAGSTAAARAAATTSTKGSAQAASVGSGAIVGYHDTRGAAAASVQADAVISVQVRFRGASGAAGRAIGASSATSPTTPPERVIVVERRYRTIQVPRRDGKVIVVAPRDRSVLVDPDRGVRP